MSQVWWIALAFVFASAMVLSGCSDDESACEHSGAPSGSIVDATRGGKPGFYWLPPVVGNPKPKGTLDTGLSPTVTICALSGDSCASTVVTLNAAQTANGYAANWQTKGRVNVDTNYRATVTAAGVELGYADVDVVSTQQEAKVTCPDFVKLVKDKPLNFAFRIEQGLVASVDVQPPAATVEAGDAQQFTATPKGLRGETLTGKQVAWSSSNTALATVDANGLGSGVAAGTASIRATVEGVVGEAALTVTQTVGSVEVTPATATLELGATQQFSATVKSVNGTVLTGRTVTWDSTDTSVATVDANGLATAVAAGSATIRATAEGVSGEALVTVSSSGFTCTGYLSNVGTGDFTISFRLALPPTAAGTYAVVNQRRVCNHDDFYWDIRMNGANEFGLEAEGPLGNWSRWFVPFPGDGTPHDVVVQRRNGTREVRIDGTSVMSGPDTTSFGPLPALNVETDPCVGSDGTQPFSSSGGTLTDVCVGPGLASTASPTL